MGTFFETQCSFALCTLCSYYVKLHVDVFIEFSQNEVGEISAGLEQYLKHIAATGQTLYASCVVTLIFTSLCN